MTARAAMLAAMAALAVATTGCGADATPDGDAPRSNRLVDFTKQPPYVNALDIDPETKDFLLTTNRGFFRIAPGSGSSGVRRVRATISVQGRRSPVGTFLEVVVSGRRRLVGSGHPDEQGALPSFLGFIRSDDAGRTWTPVSRLGDADLHKIVLAHGRMYAFDAVLSALLISRDGGRTFTENFTPRGLIIDFEVDPADPQRVVASNANELFRSLDAGASWRPLDSREGIRLAWPAPDALYRALKDGTVQRSADGGDTWQAAGAVNGEPYKFRSVGRDELYLALGDGTILHTTDAARTWTAVFRP
ncbi:MAG: WD40/YVTN/BNR-like repeat-containing protein [Solirubrobacteraceae bacterium]